MRTKTTAFILIFMLAPTLLACFYEESCDPVPEFFVVKGFRGSDYVVPTGMDQPFLETVGTMQSANWEELRLWVQFDIDFIAARQPDFGATLQALTCLEPGFGGSTVGMDTLFIKTVYDYDEAHPAGSMMNDIVRLDPQLNFASWANPNLSSVARFLQKVESGVPTNGFELRLAAPPGTSRTDFALRITCRMNDADWFTHTTKPVVVAKD